MPSLLEIITSPDLIQSQDVISFNLWQVLISLCNLLILFLILKKFLFKPVKKIMSERQAAIDAQYQAAQDSLNEADASKAAYEEKLSGADEEAAAILKSATENANRRGEAIVTEAKTKAEGIVRQAETAAELERRKAEDDIKHEIVDLSTLLTAKMLSREIKEEDHRELIDHFLSDLDDGKKE